MKCILTVICHYLIPLLKWSMVEISHLKEDHNTLYVNAAGITAAAMELMSAPPYMEMWIFATGRIRGWIGLLGDRSKVNA